MPSGHVDQHGLTPDTLSLDHEHTRSLALAAGFDALIATLPQRTVTIVALDESGYTLTVRLDGTEHEVALDHDFGRPYFSADHARRNSSAEAFESRRVCPAAVVDALESVDEDALQRAIDGLHADADAIGHAEYMLDSRGDGVEVRA